MPPTLAPVEGDSTLIPSAVFFDYETKGRVLFGAEAIAAYIGQTEGRLMRALKTILGSPLIEEKTALGGRKVALTEVVEMFVRHLKHKAEAFAGQEITAVVHGRPVRFVDDDDAADARAQRCCETIAQQVGFRDVAFVYEPIAAAHHYEQTIAARGVGAGRRYRRRHVRLLRHPHRPAASRRAPIAARTSSPTPACGSAAPTSTPRSASTP